MGIHDLVDRLTQFGKVDEYLGAVEAFESQGDTLMMVLAVAHHIEEASAMGVFCGDWAAMAHQYPLHRGKGQEFFRVLAQSALELDGGYNDADIIAPDSATFAAIATGFKDDFVSRGSRVAALRGKKSITIGDDLGNSNSVHLEIDLYEPIRPGDGIQVGECEVPSCALDRAEQIDVLGIPFRVLTPYDLIRQALTSGGLRPNGARRIWDLTSVIAEQGGRAAGELFNTLDSGSDQQLRELYSNKRYKFASGPTFPSGATEGFVRAYLGIS